MEHIRIRAIQKRFFLYGSFFECGNETVVINDTSCIGFCVLKQYNLVFCAKKWVKILENTLIVLKVVMLYDKN